MHAFEDLSCPCACLVRERLIVLLAEVARLADTQLEVAGHRQSLANELAQA